MANSLVRIAVLLGVVAAQTAGGGACASGQASPAAAGGAALAARVGGRRPGGLPAKLTQEQLLGGDECEDEACKAEHFMLLQRAAGSREAPKAPAAGGARTRAVFVAGLEGSGHHLIHNVSALIFESFPVRSVGREVPEHISQLIPGIGCHSVMYDAEHFAALRAKFREFDPQYVHMLPQMMSYPHCGGLNHVARRDYMHVHLGFLVAAAEAEGIDLHVVFLYRPVVDCLVAGCIHRNFERGNCEQYVETLTSNAGILLRQLERMKAGHVHCARYGDVDSMARGIDAACGPSVNSSAAVREIFDPSISSDGKAALDISDEASRQLQRADDALMKMCAQHSETALSAA